MMPLQEMSDRLEIQDLLARYSFAIDDHDWDVLDEVFTSDAHIDYTAAGGIKGAYPEIKAWLASVLPLFVLTQHLTATTALDLAGDTARARTILFNPMVSRDDAGAEHVMFVGLRYRDELVRTTAGWRIARRVEEKGYMTSV
ncbi:nuclear transport factor 2 family protein [Gordonia sp. (in: high G+C Gram-positive bacteria)]|uniref:nuclear transport factor 2 family protein n=1 Tax=Gordonia sp. (in: high G+C Gram-positive bacteria) TaxID=84139 RepID=UPI001690E6DA|nr:nuclear transport factor 2 family protein [Gordonia sp. (in: high G+C Gram-positive bacteria)]NLG45466.1 nuclear transport factor 2 family protein [Gordonia sp. (in: high G+C Gram-positive bacteria)]